MEWKGQDLWGTGSQSTLGAQSQAGEIWGAPQEWGPFGSPQGHISPFNVTSIML